LRIFLITFIAGDLFAAQRFDVAGVISDRPRIPGAVSKRRAKKTGGDLHPNNLSWQWL
jgi:hypothetical protein